MVMNALFPIAFTTSIHRVKYFLLLQDPSPLKTAALGALCSSQRVILYGFSAGSLCVVLLAVNL
jgi:hypothetical protein